MPAIDCRNTSTPSTSDTISSVSYASPPLATPHAVQIGVQQSHVVVAGNQVSQRGQSFVHALHHHLVGQGVADYVLENLQKCCFMTSTELAGELNVSYSSVIRLTKTLGFTGYPDFQNFLRETYAEQSRDVDTGILIPAERIEAIKKKEHKATVQDTVCAYTLSNIQSTIASNTEEQYRKASSILINSGVKYIFSSRGSTCVGEFLNTILRQTLPHVYNYGSHGQNMFDFASDLGKGDAAVFITYSRYSRLMYLTAEMVHKQGASIILLTDKPTCEAAKFADVVLTARGDSSEFYNSYVAGMFAAEMLCAYICRETNYSNQELLERIDEYTSQIGNF